MMEPTLIDDDSELMIKALKGDFKEPISMTLEDGDVCTRYWRIISRKNTKTYQIYGPYNVDENYLPARHVLSLKTCLRTQGDITLEELTNNLRKSSKRYRKSLRKRKFRDIPETVTSENEVIEVKDESDTVDDVTCEASRSPPRTPSATPTADSTEDSIVDVETTENVSVDVEDNDTAPTVLKPALHRTAPPTTTTAPAAVFEDDDTASTVLNPAVHRIGPPTTTTAPAPVFEDDDTASTVLNLAVHRTGPPTTTTTTAPAPGFVDGGDGVDHTGIDDSVCLPLKRDGGFWLDPFNELSTNWSSVKAQSKDEDKNMLFDPIDAAELSKYLSIVSDTSSSIDIDCYSEASNPSPLPSTNAFPTPEPCETSALFRFWNQNTNMSAFNFEPYSTFSGHQLPSISSRNDLNRDLSPRSAAMPRPIRNWPEQEIQQETQAQERIAVKKVTNTVDIPSILDRLSSTAEWDAPPGSIVSISSGSASEDDCD